MEEKIIETLVKKDYLEEAIEVAGLLPDRRKTFWLKNLLEKTESLKLKKKIASQLPEPEKTKLLKEITESYLKDGWLKDAKETLNLLSKDERIELAEKILNQYWERKDWEEVVEIIKLLPKSARKDQKIQEKIEMILSKLKNREGKYNWQLPFAIKVAELLSEPRRKKELRKILRECLEFYLWYETAIKAALLLSQKELKKVLAKCVEEKHLTFGRGKGGYHMADYAIDTARLLPPEDPERIQALKEISEFCMGKDNYLATRAADLLPEPDRTEQLEKIIKRCIEDIKLESATTPLEKLDKERRVYWIEKIIEKYISLSINKIKIPKELLELLPQPERKEYFRVFSFITNVY